MERILKINNSPILNFVDLKRQFDPIDIYAHLEQFCEFAEVHCLPLPTHITDRKTEQKYVASYMTKDFWLKAIRISAKYSEPTPQNLFDQIVDDMIKMLEIDDRDDKNKVFKEIDDAGINNKLSYIGNMLDDATNSRKVLSLLAICELAETVPERVDVSLWKAVPKGNRSSEIEYFTYNNDVYLKAGAQAYKFWYHDEDALKAGSAIKTVRIVAKGSANKYASVRIELYSYKTKKLVQTIILKKDEYRYCNVSDGKIIKFLPLISISDNVCLLREELRNSNLTIQTKQAEPWTLNIENVSSFASAGKDQGFILIQDGKVNSQFYKPAEDYFTRLKLEMIPKYIVEVMIRNGEYFFLLEDGSVYSGDGMQDIAGQASLSKVNRYPFPCSKPDEYCEISLSETRKSFAGFDNKSGKSNVFFDDNNNRFEVRECNGRVEILLHEGGLHI